MIDEGLGAMNIGFLRGHVAQLTQSISQFALRPGDEEIKKKGWWRFWQSHKTFHDLRYCRKIRARGVCRLLRFLITKSNKDTRIGSHSMDTCMDSTDTCTDRHRMDTVCSDSNNRNNCMDDRSSPDSYNRKTDRNSCSGMCNTLDNYSALRPY